jgi:hypothetical protein
VALAARGARETNDGTAPVEDAAVADALRRKARSVYVRTALATLASAAALYVL